MRIESHPILGSRAPNKPIEIFFDGEPLNADAGEVIAAALLAAGKKVFRYTHKFHSPRGAFCAVGRCTDCMMVVNGIPNVRTCVTRVEEGMRIERQHGRGAGQFRYR